MTGTGDFIRPSSGAITSPYGMRMHPILHYVKLHTGTDFAVGNGFSHAADTGGCCSRWSASPTATSP